MPHTVKIATCCYCGTRAALVLDRARHELACGACGAPLHEMKMLPKQHVGATNNAISGVPGRANAGAVPKGKRKKSKKSEPYDTRPAHKKADKKRKPKRRWGRKLMEELWDVVEDVFD